MKQVLLLLFLPFFSFSQSIEGKTVDGTNNEPLPSVRIITSEGNKAISNPDGTFSVKYADLPFKLIVTSISFKTDTILVTENIFLDVKMMPEAEEIESLVVTASRRGQNVEDVSISMEVLKPVLIDNKAITNLESAVDQSPGVFAMDGQVVIRGGSGYSYGAGSRVLLLWNDAPFISADAGDAKWNSVPLELASHIEVIKGASSVLYGSGALNGIIAVTEREPTKTPQIRAKLQSGLYDEAKRDGLKRNKGSYFQLAEASYGRMYRKFGFNIAVNAVNDQGYREGEIEQRGRVSGTLFFLPSKVKGLKAGIGYTFQAQKMGSFLVWENDSLAYRPQGGADISVPGSSLSLMKSVRFAVDPYLKYIGKNGNKHNLKTRVYNVSNTSLSDSTQSSSATNYYMDYQYSKNWSDSWFLSAGLTYNRAEVRSPLYGNHFSNNNSIYGQLEKKWKKFDITGGVRLEYFDQDKKRGDSDFYFGKDSTKLPVVPIFRLAAHYQPFKYTHIRASYGQGVRYPAIAERYTSTSVGSLNVFPNPNLQRETGWAAEVGIKQGVKIGNWKGFLDVAGFINEYDNMMEFTFGYYKPDSLPASNNPNNPGYILKWIGFQAQNAEKARITGIEFSFNSEGKIGQVDVRAMLGYTYMEPISLNDNKAYRATFSDTSVNILKYRFKHLAKADLEVEYKGVSLGFSGRYNSFMSNIDRIFEENIGGTYILPGLKAYRAKNQKGSLIFDARIGYSIKETYRIGFVVNNILNTEYMGRPGDIQAPRSFIVQLQFKI